MVSLTNLTSVSGSYEEEENSLLLRAFRILIDKQHA
jgi:hypothetical protein